MQTRARGLGAAVLLGSAAWLAYALFVSRARLAGASPQAPPPPPSSHEALQPSQLQYRRIVDRVEQVIFQLDTAARWTLLNPAWQDMSGHEVQASLGRPFVGFVHPDDRQVAEELCGELLAGRSDACHQDLRFLTVDGAACWTAVHARPVFEDGVCLGVAGTISNVTTRRHAQQDLERARAEAEHASAAKSEFLRSMSHEMRTPLNGVLGVMELLAATPLDPQQSGYVAAARASAAHLATLISDILDLSRLDGGAFAVERNLFDLPNLIESSLDVVASEALHKQLRVSCAVSPGVPTWVVGDAGRLRQVLVNLLSNAVKFTERGKVHVQAEAVSGIPGRKVMLRIVVRDTGIGMPQEMVDRLFRPFTQDDAFTPRRHSATGLGLTVCKRLVDAMQGTIECRSAGGAGATFTVTLPVEVADAAMVASQHQGEAPLRAAPVDPPTPPAWARPLRVLVAEDHAINQLVVREMLNSMGFAVDLVADGEAAVDAALAVPYDIVIMDCQMPVLDGIEATRRIRQARADGRTAHAPRIIALTANATDEDRQTCLEAGMDAYLTKPVRSAVLQRTLLRLMADTPTAGADDAAPRRVPHSTPLQAPGRTWADPPGAEDVLDPADVLLRCNHNGDLAARMLELFAASLPTELGLLDEAAAANDTQALGRIAHKVRGAAATLAAVRLAGAVSGVELFLKYGDDGPLADRLADVRRESALFMDVVPQIVRRLTSGTAPPQG